MALQMSFTEKGFTFSTAYFKVQSVLVSKEDGVIISVDIYADSTKQFKIKSIGFYTDFCEHCEADNPIESAYEYLKTLDFFSTATDI